jgi:hypothetical protein
MCIKALALGLVMFFAVGCDDQGIPTDASVPALDTPTPSPAILYNGWFDGSVEIWDGTGTGSVDSNCGEYIRVESERDHIYEKLTETPSGQTKYSFHINSLGIQAVGLSTGRVWAFNPVTYNFWVMFKDGSPAYREHHSARGVGHGVNTDVDILSKWAIHVNVLDSGEIVVDRSLTEIVCR